MLLTQFWSLFDNYSGIKLPFRQGNQSLHNIKE